MLLNNNKIGNLYLYTYIFFCINKRNDLVLRIQKRSFKIKTKNLTKTDNLHESNTEPYVANDIHTRTRKLVLS